MPHDTLLSVQLYECSAITSSTTHACLLTATHSHNDLGCPDLPRSYFPSSKRARFIEGKKEVKEVDLYSAFIEYLTLKALRYGSHSVTCKLHRTCLYLVSIHQMAHPRLRLRTSNCSILLIYLPRKDERLSWPRWLVTYWDSLPARRQSPIPVLTGLDVEQLR